MAKLMTEKFELTEESKQVYGVTLYRIKALKDFGNVRKGDLGGWVQGELNLSPLSDAWVSGRAQVSGDAWVSGNARVSGRAQVSGDAWVSGNARVYGGAQVSGNARVSGDARVSGRAQVSGDARVSGDAWVFGDAQILLISPIANDYWITLHKTREGSQINIGCWSGTVDELLPKVRTRDLFDQQIAEYEALIPLLRTRIKSWEPVKTEREIKIELLEK